MTTSIQLPAKTFLRNVNGEAINIDWAKVPAAILPSILEVGAKTVLTNAFNGGGKDAADSDKLAAMMKKLDAWYRGEFNVVTRGESGMTQLREQYIDERREATGQTRSAVESQIKALVKQVFGADEAASFGKFLDAVATIKHKQDDSKTVIAHREVIEEGLADRAAKAAAKRAKEASKLDLSDIDLGL